MVDTRRGEHERLRGGTELDRKAREDRLAQRLGARRATGLARANHNDTKRREALLEPFRLNRLSSPLAAFKRDEPAFRRPGHGHAFGCEAPLSASPVKPRRMKPTACPSGHRLKPGRRLSLPCIVRCRLATAARARLKSRSATDGLAAQSAVSADFAPFRRSNAPVGGFLRRR